MLTLLAEIWPCLIAAAILGIAAGWLLWGRDMRKVVSSYRRRLSKARANWENVEERLTQALSRASTLERERDAFQKDWSATQLVLQEREEAWKQERRLLDETVRQLNQRLLVLETNVRAPSAQARSKRDLGQ
jgi:chromosome segregation ATPase